MGDSFHLSKQYLHLTIDSPEGEYENQQIFRACVQNETLPVVPTGGLLPESGLAAIHGY
jgi:hypothetical protein